MKIKVLELKNFKSHREAAFVFGDDVKITGDNFQGKSSIGDAIVFLLEGTTATGSNRTDDLIHMNYKKTQVRGVLTFDGTTDVEIIREKTARSHEIFIDGKKSSQAEIDAIIGARDRVLSVLFPGYFTRMTPAKGREMLMHLIHPPSREEVLKRVGETWSERLKGLQLRNPDSELAAVREQLTVNQKEYDRVTGQIDVYRETIGQTVSDPVAFDDTELQRLIAKRDEIRAGAASNLERARAELKAIRPRYDDAKRQLKKIPDAPHKLGEPCPVCARELTEDVIGHVLSHHSSQAAELEKHNASIIEQCNQMIAEGERLAALVKELETQANVDELRRIEQEIEIQEGVRSDYQRRNANVEALLTQQLNAQKKLQEAQSTLKELSDSSFQLGEDIKAINAYRSHYAEMQVEQLKKFLDKAGVELFDIAKSTGEIKSVFTITYDDKPFSMLSLSEQMRCNLEFCSMFNKVIGFDIPVFIDNAESITSYERPYATQVFTARVVPGATLSVE